MGDVIWVVLSFVFSQLLIPVDGRYFWKGFKLPICFIPVVLLALSFAPVFGGFMMIHIAPRSGCWLMLAGGLCRR